MDNHDVDPTLVAEARALADRARRDSITLTMLVQAATAKLRPGFAAALDYALQAGWIEGVAGGKKGWGLAEIIERQHDDLDDVDDPTNRAT